MNGFRSAPSNGVNDNNNFNTDESIKTNGNHQSTDTAGGGISSGGGGGCPFANGGGGIGFGVYGNFPKLNESTSREIPKGGMLYGEYLHVS